MTSNAFVRTSLLPAGFLTLPEYFFCADQCDKTIKTLAPSMAFLLEHLPTGKKIVFDLGIRRDLNGYPENIQPHLKTRQPIHTVPDVCDSLRKGGIQPADIDAVILSHMHYDHVGTPSEFTNAKFIVGHGSRHVLEYGMSYHSAAKFEKDLLPSGRVIELPVQKISPKFSRPFENKCLPTDLQLSTISPGKHEYEKLGPFENTIDLFEDGSMYIIDSPGHLFGHLNVLARIASDRWMYLAGDACHHPRILRGESEMAEWKENGQHVCIHVDKQLATETVGRIRQLVQESFRGGTVDVALAHDLRWYNDHQGAVFPGFL